MPGYLPPVVLELEGRDAKALAALRRTREELQKFSAQVQRLNGQLAEATVVNERYAASLSATGVAGRRAAEGTTAMGAGARRAAADTAAMGTQTRAAGAAARGLSAEARAAGQEATRFARRAQLAGEQSELLANRARLASAESARLAEQAALGGQGAAALGRQARSAAAEAERLGNRARIAGEQAQWLGERSTVAGQEAARLAAQEQAAAAETTRLGQSAARTSTMLGVMGAETRRAAGGAGVLSGGALRMGSALNEGAASGNRFTAGLRRMGLTAAAIGIGVAAISVKLAADFQSQMVRMRTSAGETGDIVDGRLTGNLKLVSAGIKKVAVDTGTPMSELADGMYRIESAGFHGAEGLKILTAAAEGARSEGANLDTVANTLDSTMNAFGFSTKNVNGVMNAMVATVSHGKATMEELAGALPVVTAKASAAGLSLQQMLGAMATMTSQGVSARQAAQNLQFTIGALQGPSSVARNAMNSIGIDSLKLSKNLGKNGLTGTFATMSEAVTNHMGKDGLVIVKTMNDSAVATASAQKLLKGMTGDTKRLSQSYYDGSISLGSYKKAVKALPADQANLAMQFKGTADQANGFNVMLRNGSGPQKTYSDMIKKMTGGQAGLNTFLQLSGIHAKTFNDNVALIGKSAEDNSKHVEGFAEVQKTFNFQMAKVKEIAITAATSLGEKLLPILQKVFAFFEKHKTLAKVLAISIIGIAAALGIASVAIIAFEVAASPVGIVTLAIVGLGIALVALWQHSIEARNVMTIVFAVLGTVALQYVKIVLESLKWVTNAFLAFVTLMVDLAAKAFSWVPGVGGKLKTAQKAIDGFKNDTYDVFDSMIHKVDDWNATLLAMPHTVQLKGEITDLTKKIADAKKQLSKKNLPESKRVKLDADITAWQLKLALAKAALAGTPNKRIAILTAQITDWQKKIATAKAQLSDKNLPDSKKTTLMADITDLQHKIAQAKTAIKSVKGSTVTVAINTVKTTVNKDQYFSQGPHAGAADGALFQRVRKMADGGAGRPAMMARGGSSILWAEAGDESYIPHDRRPRSRAIAEQTVGIMGGTVSWGGGGGAAGAVAPLGAQVARGLWAGLDGQAAWLSGHAARFATETIPGPMAKALEISSPSKVAASLGRYTTQGLAVGMTGSTAQVKTASQKVADLIRRAFSETTTAEIARDRKALATLANQRKRALEQIANAEDRLHAKGSSATTRAHARREIADRQDALRSIAVKEAAARRDIASQQRIRAAGVALTRTIAADNARLATLARQRDQVAGRLAAAQDKLAGLKKSSADLKAQLAGGIIQGAGIVTASPDEARAVNAADVLAQLRGNVVKDQQFASELAQLKKKGLRSDLLEQLAAAGSDQGGATALALSAGSKAQIAEVNRLQGTLTTAANASGAVVANAMYAAGIRSAQGLVKGLQAQEHTIEAQMLRIAKSMQTAIREALGIRSPSTVMATEGDNTALGVAVGIQRSTKHARIAAQGLAMAVRQGASVGTLSGAVSGGGYGGGGTQITNVYLTVQGSVASENNLLNAIETGLTRRARRNPGGLRPSNPWNGQS